MSDEKNKAFTQPFWFGYMNLFFLHLATEPKHAYIFTWHPGLFFKLHAWLQALL